jgi:hypothetical protein
MPVMTSIAKAMSREHPELDHDDFVALGVSRPSEMSGVRSR